MHRRHRLGLGLCAAVALAWGLVGAPLAHQLVPHQHAPVLGKPRALKLKTAKRSHTPPPPAQQQQHEHGAMNLEHGVADLHVAAAPPQKVEVAVLTLTLPREARRAPPYRAAWRHTEQPQGP